MIELSHITIAFDHTLLNDAFIHIEDGKVTTITGESGCGKTSLLYLIGLLSTNQSYKYFFDGKIIELSSEKEVAIYQKRKIGYIFQDNSLINNLTIGENVKFAARVAGIIMSDEEVKDFLKSIKLNLDIKKYPRVLSGGEQQRLAIACAMAKQPDLIIADEPTSALDETNVNLIMGMFHRYVKNTAKKVVIASHNQNVCNKSDTVYCIENKQIELISRKNVNNDVGQDSDSNLERKPLGVLFYLQHSIKTFRKSKLQTIVMIILCSIAIAFAVSIKSLGSGMVNYQTDQLNNISDRELFLINFTAPLTSIVDVDEHISISENEYQAVRSITNIESIYPYFEFRSVGYDLEKSDFINSCMIKVEKDDTESKFDFSTDYDGEYKSIAIIPYYPEQNIEKRVLTSFESNNSNKIYVSYKLSALLGIDSTTSKVKLTTNIGIPVYTTNVELSVGAENAQYDADIDIMLEQELSFEIAGILDVNYNNHHSASGDNVIYMPIDYMNQLKEDCIEKAGAVTPNEEIILNKWASSAYMIYVKSYNDISATIEKAEKINPNFKIISDYQDVEAMNAMLSGIKNTATSVIVIVLSIIFILMAIIYINRTLGRQYEIAVMKANGLTKFEINKVALTEAILHVVIVVALAIILCIAVIHIINLLFAFDVAAFSLNTIVTIVIISLLSVIIPVSGSLLIINRIKPDRLLRN
ncbi:MAG: ATP-binding cassette domain-containing protein [Oscillospiraceae bacterium]|nr:ATP-binding cassette domain-containing protein [Oscillospiraceae bacterium]